MALVQCPECTNQVSDRSPACPRCGFPMAELSHPTPASISNKKVCPNCGSENFIAAEDCFCGYSFVAEVNPRQTIEPTSLNTMANTLSSGPSSVSLKEDSNVLYEQAYKRERKFFLGGFLTIVATSILVRLIATQSGAFTSGESRQFLVLLTLAAKGTFIYLVFRFSRFLRKPWWLTILYCALAPIAILYLVPFIGLLGSGWKAKRSLPKASTSPSIEPSQEV